ncbi:hypothetical protein CJJ07_000807 [Candidozyma auris]|nr:hypothetical protein CJJ07_000807 [[Candida] auris]
MTSYISGILQRFQTPEASGTAIAKDNAELPSINYITMYNPHLVSPKAESFEELYKMILFFADPSKEVDKHAQLSLVGLIRGSCSLAQEFSPKSGPTTISVEGGAIVVVEVEKGFHLVCSVALPAQSASQRRLVEIQIEILLQRFHGYFKLLHSSAQSIFKNEIQEQSQRHVLEGFYIELIENYNEATSINRLRKTLLWPNSLCYSGLFSFFPYGTFKKSSVRVPDSHRPELENLWEKSPLEPAAILVAHMDHTVPKREGLLYKKSKDVDEKALNEVYGLIEFFSFHQCLSGERLGSRRPFKNLFAASSTSDPETAPEAVEVSEESLPSSLPLTPGNAMQLLHPSTLAQTLVVSPLSSTLQGIKYLGSTVNEQLASSWLPFRSNTEPADSAQEPDTVSSTASNPIGRFVLGPDSENNIYSFLVHLPASDSNGDVCENSVVIYIESNVLLAFVFDSSAQELADPAFYQSLRLEVCEPAVELIGDCIALSSGGMMLNSSISSLPNPVGNIIKDEDNPDIDSDFFFIIYDTQDKSYQTSLPWLPQPSMPSSVNNEVARVSYHYQNAFFHLHDKLSDYFVMRSAGNIFLDTAVREHLHKFSTNKNNDWLMYFIRHRQKSIIIIRNYNTKHKKSKVIPKEVAQASSWTSSVYDYAHLGFLDSLGDDVKVWLSNLRAEEST